MSDAPTLSVVHGEVALVFPRGVSLRSAGKYRTFECEPDVSEDSRSLQGQQAQAVVLKRACEMPKVLRIDPEGTEYGGTPEQRWEYISKRWDNVLRRLKG